MPSRSTCTTGEMLGLFVFCGNCGSALTFKSEAASKAAGIVRIIPSGAALLSSCAGIPAVVASSRNMATNRTASWHLRPGVTLSIWSDFHCSKNSRACSLIAVLHSYKRRSSSNCGVHFPRINPDGAPNPCDQIRHAPCGVLRPHSKNGRPPFSAMIQHPSQAVLRLERRRFS